MASAHVQTGSLKQHGDTLEGATENTDRQAKDSGAIPKPERGTHEKSHAAHLGGNVHDHTKPEGNLHPGASGELREPPQEVSRVGKQHRKQ